MNGNNGNNINEGFGNENGNDNRVSPKVSDVSKSYQDPNDIVDSQEINELKNNNDDHLEDGKNILEERNISASKMDSDEENKNTEISRLQEEIEQKNNILLQLKAELERQEDYKNLQQQCKILKSQNDNDLENNEVQVADHPFSNEKGILKENDFNSHSLEEQTSTETNEVELFRKIQVMQTMNPAIKALMNYRGINLFPWINKLEENAQKVEKGLSPPSSDLTTEIKRFSSPCTFQEDHKLPGTNTITSPLVSSISRDSSPFPNPITLYSTPMLQNIFSQKSAVGHLNSFNQLLPPSVKIPTEQSENKPFWSPFHLSQPSLTKDSNSLLSNRTDINSKLPCGDPNTLPKISYPPPPFLSTGRIPKFDPLEGHLQDMLRYNMERYGGGAFDTIECARRVREILSVHNIGQRLFAKYVLGLSQGTVSELLSKPKCWEKLTEKGRDSYRKMHAWVYDERAIAMLKTLIPRKSELVRAATTSAASFQAQLVAQDKEEMKRRFEGISQATAAAKDFHSFPPTMPMSQEVLNASKLFPLTPNLNNKNDEMNAIGNNEHEDNDEKPFGKLRTNDDSLGIQRAMEIYHNELRRIHGKNEDNMIKQGSVSSSNPGSPEVTFPSKTPDASKRDQSNGDESNHGKEGNFSDDSNNEKVNSELSSAPHNLQLVSPSRLLQSPSSSSLTDTSFNKNSTHPLKQIASITDSLQGRPPTSIPFPFPMPSGSYPVKPYKSILQPLNQTQIDRYESLNTDEVVRQIKDLLSSYSISQRLFGEACLGLSQGSVSDLLARPKPFHMLTQKGKEPFIRMKMFLEDETAMHRLVASQYNISPDKLLRTQTSTGVGAKSPYPFPVGIDSVENPLNIQNFLQSCPSLFNPSSFPFLPGVPLPTDRSTHDAFPIKQLLAEQHQKRLSGETISNLISTPSHVTNYSSINVSNIGSQQPEVNTNEMVIRVKSILSEHNIAQKVFGKYVLCLSQGSVSEIMNKPKPWHMLSVKGREPYIRMQIWLKDPNNVVKLKKVHNDGNVHSLSTIDVLDPDKMQDESSRLSDGASLSPASHIRSPFPSKDENKFDDNSCIDLRNTPEKRSSMDCNAGDENDDSPDPSAAKRQKMDHGSKGSEKMEVNGKHNSAKDVLSCDAKPSHIFMEYISKNTKIDPKFLEKWFQTQGILPLNASPLLKPSNEDVIDKESSINSP